MQIGCSEVPKPLLWPGEWKYPAPSANIPPLLQYWGGVLGLLRWFGVLFFLPMYTRGCKGLPGWFGFQKKCSKLEHFFSTFVHLTERGGEDLSNLGNAHIEPTHFKKGLPFPKNIPFSSILGTCKGLLGWFGAFFLHKFARRCRDLPGWLGTLFSTFVSLTEGGVLSDLGNGHIDPTHFKKGLS